MVASVRMDIRNSERLAFRLLNLEEQEDSEFVFQLDQDPLVMRYINGGQVSTRENHERVRARVAHFANPERGWGLWGVFEQSSEEFAGWLLLRPIGFFTEHPLWDDLEVGWRFRRETWGQGYATEAARALKTALSLRDDVAFMSAFVDPKNIASLRVIEKLGMRSHRPVPEMEPGYADRAAYYRCEL